MNIVRKITQILLGVVLAVCWILTIRFLFLGAWFQLILMVVILIAPTLAFLRALAVSKANNAPAKDDLADSFEPFTAQPNPSVQQPGAAVCYCPSCGTQNKVGDKFCCGCGKNL